MLSLPYAGRLILISGYVTDADRRMLESAGSPEILQKPVAPDKLLAAVSGRKG
jgi:hypothetical protein